MTGRFPTPGFKNLKKVIVTDVLSNCDGCFPGISYWGSAKFSPLHSCPYGPRRGLFYPDTESAIVSAGGAADSFTHPARDFEQKKEKIARIYSVSISPTMFCIYMYKIYLQMNEWCMTFTFVCLFADTCTCNLKNKCNFSFYAGPERSALISSVWKVLLPMIFVLMKKAKC